MNLPEILQRLENIIRIGTILAVLPGYAPRVRVKTGAIETDWLSFFERRSGTTTDWDLPSVGEQCLIFSPSGVVENGVVLVGVASDDFGPPSTNPNESVRKYPDGVIFKYNFQDSHLDITAPKSFRAKFSDDATFEYNAASSHLSAQGMKTGYIQSSESLTFDTPQATFTQKLTALGLFTYTAGMAGFGGTAGTKIIGDIEHEGKYEHQGDYIHVGKIKNTGEIASNNVVLDKHTHGGVLAGGSNSLGPNV